MLKWMFFLKKLSVVELMSLSWWPVYVCIRSRMWTRVTNISTTSSRNSVLSTKRNSSHWCVYNLIMGPFFL